MKKFVLTLALAAMAFVCADAEKKTKTYDFGDIVSVEAGHSYEIVVTQGRSGKVNVEFDERLEKYMEVRHNGAKGLLVLRMDEMPFKFRTGNIPGPKVYLEMDKISSIDLSGAASIRFEGEFKTDELDIDLSGASDMRELKIEGRSLDIDCSGATNLTITGDFMEDADIDMSGASKAVFTGSTLTLECDLSGACNFRGTGSYDECNVSCSGASEARLEGDGDTFEAECSGASKIEAKEFVTKKAKVYLSGSSKAVVNASKTLTYDVSRASKMVYYGDAELKDISQNSNIEKGR